MKSKEKTLPGKYVFIYYGNDFFPCLSLIEEKEYNKEKRLELAVNAKLSLSGESTKEFFKKLLIVYNKLKKYKLKDNSLNNKLESISSMVMIYKTVDIFEKQMITTTKYKRSSLYYQFKKIDKEEIPYIFSLFILISIISHE